MNSEDKILKILTEMQSDVSDLKRGQSNLEAGQARLEESHVKLEKSQTKLEDGLLEVRSKLKTLESNQLATSIALSSFREDQKTIKSAVLRIENEDIPAIIGRLDGVESRFDGLESRFDNLETLAQSTNNGVALIEGDALPKIQFILEKIDELIDHDKHIDNRINYTEDRLDRHDIEIHALKAKLAV